MGLEFRDISAGDRDWINELLRISDFQSCEYSFANNFAWRRLSDSKICRFKDFYFLRSFSDGKPFYTFPAGNGDLEEVIALMREDAGSFGSGLSLRAVLKPSADKLSELFGNRLSVRASRDSFDYIYSVKRLTELSGKKLHGKRNHISNFKKTPWEYKPLTEDKFDDCLTFSATEYNERNAYSSHSATAEQFAINAFFTNFRELDLKGGVLYQCGRLVGFTIGARLNSNTMDIHVEKALRSAQGAYPTLFNEFLKAEAQGFEYVNREDDVGIEGLRRSKLSYCPDYLLEKYNIDYID